VQLTDIYTQAAIHYDTKEQKAQADIYRSKIQILFAKPQILTLYAAQQSVSEKKDDPKQIEAKQIETRPSNEQPMPSKPQLLPTAFIKVEEQADTFQEPEATTKLFD
jgi:hypothetical protein